MSAQPTRSSSAQVLRQLLLGYQTSQVVFAAIELDIPGLLQSGSKSAEEIANSVGATHATMKYLLRALVAVGILNQEATERYVLSELGVALLEPNRPDLASALTSFRELYNSWSALSEMVKTDQPGFSITHGGSFWDYLNTQPKALENALALVSVTIEAKLPDLLDKLDFSRFKKVVDIGGARGTLVQAILKRHAHLTGVLFDRPEVVSDALSEGTLADLSTRCQVIGGNFLNEIPSAGDVYVLARVLHDWDEERATTILSNCYRAMDSGQTLFIIEKIPDPDDLSMERVMADLKMCVMFGGHERTEDEYSSLLERTGFCLEQIINTRCDLWIIEATRIG